MLSGAKSKTSCRRCNQMESLRSSREASAGRRPDKQGTLPGCFF